MTNEILELEMMKHSSKINSIRTRIFTFVTNNIFNPEMLIIDTDFKPVIVSMQGGQYRVEIHKDNFFFTLSKTSERGKLPPCSNYRLEFSKHNPKYGNIIQGNFVDQKLYGLNNQNIDKVYGILSYGLDWKGSVCEISHSDIIIPNKDYSSVIDDFPLDPGIEEVHHGDISNKNIIDKTALKKKVIKLIEEA